MSDETIGRPESAAASSDSPSDPSEKSRQSDRSPEDQLRHELEEATRKGQEYLGLAQRAQADLVNYRRRVEQERGESLQAGKAALAVRVLPILDDFERALKVMPAELGANEWVQGVTLIARKLRGALEAEGISRIEALGKEFDPWEHEAVMQAEAAPEDAGRVLEVFRDGYKQGNKVLRPAQVKVGRSG